MTEKGMLLTLEYMISMYKAAYTKKEERAIKHIINEFHYYAMPETDEGEEKFWELLAQVGISE